MSCFFSFPISTFDSLDLFLELLSRIKSRCFLSPFFLNESVMHYRLMTRYLWFFLLLFLYVSHTFSRHESAPSSLPAVLLVPLWIVLSACIGVLLALATSFLFLFGLFWILLDRCRVLFKSKSRLLCFESLKDHVFLYCARWDKSFSGEAKYVPHCALIEAVATVL